MCSTKQEAVDITLANTLMSDLNKVKGVGELTNTGMQVQRCAHDIVCESLLTGAEWRGWTQTQPSSP